MIPKETIDKIFHEARIEEVIGDFLQLKKKGSDYWACCPFHNEKSPSFSVSVVKGIFKCFGCGEGGNAVDFLMKHEQLSYPEALRYLAQKYNIHIEEKVLSDEQKLLQSDKESLYIVSNVAKEYFKDQLFNTDEGKSIGLGYFKERGFSEETIKYFELGFCPDKWDYFSSYALKNGYQTQYLIKSGLSKEKNGSLYDTFRGRVLFPIHNISGRTIGFGGRILTNDKKLAKYINSPESEIYEKSKTLYGIFQAKKEIAAKQNCYLVEGYTDVISMYQAGVKNVAASSGTSLTKDQIKLIKRYTNHVTILYDGDFAGIKASFRGIDMILEEGMNVKVILFPDGEDPDSYSRKLSSEDFIRFIEQQATDFIEFKAKSLFEETKTDPFKKSEIIHNILQSISLIPDPIARSLYIKTSATLIDVEENILILELNKLVRKNARENNKNFSEIPQESIEIVERNHHVQGEDILEDKVEIFEKDILRLILNFADKIIVFKDANSESIEIKVFDFFVGELERDGLYFISKDILTVYETVKQLFQQQSFSLDQLYKHDDLLVRNIAIELTSSKYILSAWDRKNIIVNTEEMLLKRAVMESLYSYKVYRINAMILEHEQQLKITDSTPNFMVETIQKLMLLKELKRKLTLEIGRPI